MQRPFKHPISITTAVFILIVFFAFGLPPILESILESQILKNLNRHASVESVSFNPFKLQLTIENLSIREKKSDAIFVSVEKLRVNAEIISLFKGGIALREVSLVKPYVHLLRNNTDIFNFSDIIPETEAKPETKPAKPVLFSIANISISNGTFKFDDLPKKTIHNITDLELKLPLVSNFKHQVDIFVQPIFSASIDGKALKLEGKSKPFADSLETNIEINIIDLNLAQYLPYVPQKLNFKMPSGQLNTHLRLNYIQKSRKASEVNILGSLALNNLEIVSNDKKPILSLPAFAVSGINCKLSDRDIVIDEITVEGMTLDLVREKDGSISLQKLVEADSQTADKATPTQQTDENTPEWNIMVKKFGFTGGNLSFNDLSLTQPAQFRIDPIDLKLNNISVTKNSSAGLNLNCSINDKSPLSLTGTFMINPLTANLKIDLADFDISTAQNYLPETLKLDLINGILELNGSIDFKSNQDADPDIIWQGDIHLKKFAAACRGDKEKLLTFSSLDLKSMRIWISPFALDIKTIKIDQLFLRPVITPDGTLNITSLQDSPEPAASGSASPSSEEVPSPDINIGNIILNKSRILFTDKNIKPHYSADLSDIQGRILNISTKPDAQADIQLSAMLNRYAPLKVSGTIKPLQKALDADINILFNKIDMSPFSPYSGKFIGRLIEKGRLSFDLAYHIKNNQLTSQNKVSLDQFTLGKNVKSKDATSLPVGLAISLLKNRKGEILLDLPVSGSLDDPSFRIRKVVLKTLVNLLEKAATSPFSLLGKLVPGGVDISNITFTCGNASLNSEAIKKLDVLAGLLVEKTGLSLEIQASAETELDREGLREEMVLNKLRMQKFNDLSKKERAGIAPNKLIILKEENEKYLRNAYKAEKFQKPQGMLGLNKRLPTEEMKKLMLENTEVNDNDMNDLLHQRGLAVKQYLTETGKVSAERLFIIDSKFNSSKSPKGCNVEFRLK